MRFGVIALAAAATVAITAPAAATTFVDANSSGKSLGFVVAGVTYKITATGIVDLVGDKIPGGSFNVDAAGVPTSPVTAPGYGYFNPDGSPTADGQSGPLPGANFGALIGYLQPNVLSLVTPANTYFYIGKSLTTSFAESGELFARINDINTNNSGGFTVSLTAVPEPATWGMMILGFGVVGAGMRRRANRTVRVTYA